MSHATLEDDMVALPSPRRLRLGSSAWLWEIAFLCILFVVLGRILVPAHWTSIWMDREFTGWVAPISNRLAEGQKLYEDGAHSPMPPLPTVLLFALFRGEATWLSESALCFVFQCATLLVMYAALTATTRRPIPFIATVAAFPIFLSLQKTIFYDPCVQLFTALAIATTAGCINALDRARRNGRVSGGAAFWLILLGASAATALLTKQSTGGGVVLGVCVVLLLFPRGATWPMRIGSLSLFLAATAAGFLLWCAVLSPFVSIPGLVEDVFLTGSQPKGGVETIVSRLGMTAMRLAGLGALAVGAAGVLAAVAGKRRQAAQSPDCGAFSEDASLHDSPSLVREWMLRCGAAMAAVVGLVSAAALPQSVAKAEIAVPLLWCGLAVLLVLVTHALVTGRRQFNWSCGSGLAVMSIVALFAAAFHSLSVNQFRWTYDNNPLIVLAIAGIAGFLVTALRGSSGRRRNGMSVAFAAVASVMTFLCWVELSPQLKVARSCTMKWPEVAHLRGARLRPETHGMRELVRTVRGLTPGNDTDTVLLLPSDPNVEAWFERPRPRLSSAIVFADQYWDRYVDEDIARLKADPPRLIVIGPQGYWRGFGSNLNFGRATERMIDGVERKLLPREYVLSATVPIQHQRRIDSMKVYVRRGPRLARARLPQQRRKG